MSPSRTAAMRAVNVCTETLLHAALVYGDESDGGTSPLAAGAHLRIAAKDFRNKKRALQNVIVEESLHRTLTPERRTQVDGFTEEVEA
jgi:hypothetical protein